MAFVTLGMFILGACEEEYEIPGDPNFSDPAATRGPDEIQVADFVSFSDLSQGVSSRTWTVPESAEILNDNGATTSSKSIIHVKFNSPGEHDVKLTSAFNNPDVSLDSTFTITVYDSITANIAVTEVLGKNAEIGADKIKIEAGSQVVWADNSTGNPNTWKWSFEGADIESADTETITTQYKSLGFFDVSLISSRVNPYGRPDTVVLADFVEVIPSSEPILVNKIEENEAGQIQIFFSRNVDIPLNEEGNFTVKIDDVEATINSITRDAIDESIINIAIAENFRNVQTGMVSYNGNGALQSSDFVKIAAFTDTEASPFFVNLLANSGFETGDMTGWSNWDQGAGAVEVTSDAAFSGDFGLHITRTDAQNNIYNTLSTTIEEGKMYRIRFNIRHLEGDGDKWHFAQIYNPDPWATTGQKWYPTKLDWQTIDRDVEGAAYAESVFQFAMRADGDYYVDNVVVFEIDPE